jgi:hypothetical protein
LSSQILRRVQRADKAARTPIRGGAHLHPNRRTRGRTIRAAFPPGPRPDRAATLRRLGELRERGVVTDAEFDALRARLRV